MTNQYKLIDAPVNVKTIKIEDIHLTAIEKKAIKAGMKQGMPCFKSGRKIYTISHVNSNIYRVEIEEKQTTIFNRLETVKHFATFSVCLEKAKQKFIEQLEVEQLQLILTQEESIETKEETKEAIDNTVVKLQAKLTRLNAQLAVTRGNRSKAKIVIEILKVELAIEQNLTKVKKTIEQSKPIDAPVTKKDEFCKKAEKTTIKFLEAKFKDAQIDITDKQIVIKSGTSELSLNLSFEIPDVSDYYNHYRRAKTIKNLKQNQTSKIHSVCEYVGSILLAS